MARRRLAIAIILVALVAGLAGGAWFLWKAQPEAVARVLAGLDLRPATPVAEGLLGSGTIEATEISVVAEMGGQLKEVLAQEGEQVEAGQVLARLDTAILDAQIRQAQARVRAMKAAQALVEAGPRPEEVAQAEAAVAQAQAAAEAARQTWQNAIALRDNQQDLEVRIASVQGQVQVAQRQVEAAEAAARAAQQEQELLGRVVRMLEEGYDILIPDPGGGYTTTHVNAPPQKLEEARYQWNLASQRAWEMWKGLDAAKTALEGYARSLSNLVGQKEDPLVLEAQVAAAEASMRVAEAAVGEAQAALEALKEGATAEQKEVARAQVREAEALVRVLEAQRAKAEVLAPADALVLERLVHRGEAVTPGALLFRLAQLDTVYLTVYVAEKDLGLVRLGQAVAVTVDSFPGRVFEGKVVHIATEAEFTPKNVQTREERVNMVFGVKVEIPNPEHLLKPGMPADAVIRTGSTP